MEKLINQLNAADKEDRLDALREIARMKDAGKLASPNFGDNINNHIHTIYSFSPYSPTMAVYRAWASGLATAGIMDHDSVAGVEEFLLAGGIMRFPVTVGFECRCSLAGTPFEGKMFSNPDQASVGYFAMHGLPRQSLGEAEAFLKPCREKRNVRNRKMVERLNAKLAMFGMRLDFDKDVLPISQYANGGSITERHLMYALASAITSDENQRYFLLGDFKSQLLESVYVNADDELPHILDFIELGEKLGAIPAYAYLGDVGVSVTGDKKKQTLEDPHLDEYVAYLADIGMKAITYMPARNTLPQLQRLMALCEKHSLFQISGEDINSPFQKFVCEKIEAPEFRHLIDSAWALIGHEKATAAGLEKGMFSAETVLKFPELNDRIRYYADLARK